MVNNCWLFVADGEITTPRRQVLSFCHLLLPSGAGAMAPFFYQRFANTVNVVLLIFIRWYRLPSAIKNLGYPFLIHRCGTGLCYPVLQTDDFSGHLLFAFRRRSPILLFASPVVGLWFIQAKFTGGCGHTHAFLTKFRRVLRAWLFGGLIQALSFESPLVESLLT